MVWSGHLMNVFRVVGLIAIFWVQSFPAGLTVSLIVTSFASAAQMLILRAPRVRHFFNIPPLVKPPGGEFRLPSFRESLKYYFNQTDTGGTRLSTTGTVRAYVPPTAPAPPRQARTMDELVAQQSRPSSKSSDLFETAPTPAPTAKKTTKATKATKATKSKAKK